MSPRVLLCKVGEIISPLQKCHVGLAEDKGNSLMRNKVGKGGDWWDLGVETPLLWEGSWTGWSRLQLDLSSTDVEGGASPTGDIWCYQVVLHHLGVTGPTWSQPDPGVGPHSFSPVLSPSCLFSLV